MSICLQKKNSSKLIKSACLLAFVRARFAHRFRSFCMHSFVSVVVIVVWLSFCSAFATSLNFYALYSTQNLLQHIYQCYSFHFLCSRSTIKRVPSKSVRFMSGHFGRTLETIDKAGLINCGLNNCEKKSVHIH